MKRFIKAVGILLTLLLLVGLPFFLMERGKDVPVSQDIPPLTLPDLPALSDSLSGFLGKPEETVTPPVSLPPETEPPRPPSPAAALLSELTLREKVGQLFIVRPEALTQSGPDTAVTDSLLQGLSRYPVGGVILFGDNILSTEQVTAFLSDLEAVGRVPPFLAVDEEGGVVSRIANNPSFHVPRYLSPASVAAEEGETGCLNMGLVIGQYLKNLGFHMDFAPVADVSTNPRNPVIGSRSFSSDPEIAAECARAMADGLWQKGILPVYKHFPGHGDTAEDSHLDLAVTHKTAEELSVCEWLPFRQVTEHECIMVGHIAAPEVTGDFTPATLSPILVRQILKNELGFEGLIITDSLEMAAITDSYDSGDAALAALRAGCHMLLMPQDLPEAFEAIVTAVEQDTFPQEELDEAVLKILEFKMEYGLITP